MLLLQYIIQVWHSQTNTIHQSNIGLMLGQRRIGAFLGGGGIHCGIHIYVYFREQIKNRCTYLMPFRRTEFSITPSIAILYVAASQA